MQIYIDMLNARLKKNWQWCETRLQVVETRRLWEQSSEIWSMDTQMVDIANGIVIPESLQSHTLKLAHYRVIKAWRVPRAVCVKQYGGLRWTIMSKNSCHTCQLVEPRKNTRESFKHYTTWRSMDGYGCRSSGNTRHQSYVSFSWLLLSMARSYPRDKDWRYPCYHIYWSCFQNSWTTLQDSRVKSYKQSDFRKKLRTIYNLKLRKLTFFISCINSKIVISVYNTCTLLYNIEKYVDANLDAPDNAISG